MVYVFSDCPDGCASCHEDDGTIKCLECKATYAVDNSDTSNLKCEGRLSSISSHIRAHPIDNYR